MRLISRAFILLLSPKNLDSGKIKLSENCLYPITEALELLESENISCKRWNIPLVNRYDDIFNCSFS